MNRKEQFRKWLWYFSIPAAAILLYKLYDNFGEALGVVGQLIRILSPFVGGFVLAFFLLGPSRWLEERILSLQGRAWSKLARPLALAVTYLVFLGLLSLLFYLIIPVLVRSLTDLAESLPQHLTATHEKVQQLTAPGGLLENLGLETKLNELYNNLQEAFSKILTPQNITAAIKRVGNVASSLINVVISFVVSIYMLHGREHLGRALHSFMGLFVRPKPLAKLQHYTHRSGSIFSRYVYGALLDALIVGVVVSIGLLIFRVPYAFLLGMLLGVMNLVPYFGAIVGCIGIAFVALLTNGFPVALGVVIYIIVAQQVDANIIQPRIVGSSMGLRPFYVLLGITLFGGLLGFWGILLGPPLMAVIQMIVRDCYSRRNAETVLECESNME